MVSLKLLIIEIKIKAILHNWKPIEIVIKGTINYMIGYLSMIWMNF